MTGESNHTKETAQQLGPGNENSCSKCSSVGKYGINDKLLESSVVSYVSGECEVKRKGNPIMNRFLRNCSQKTARVKLHFLSLSMRTFLFRISDCSAEEGGNCLPKCFSILGISQKVVWVELWFLPAFSSLKKSNFLPKMVKVFAFLIQRYKGHLINTDDRLWLTDVCKYDFIRAINTLLPFPVENTAFLLYLTYLCQIYSPRLQGIMLWLNSQEKKVTFTEPEYKHR